MRIVPCLSGAALLASCAAVSTPMSSPEPDRPLAYARFGQDVRVNGPSVRPLSLLEDSRCPTDVRCVWAGRVRITARVTTGAGAQVRELELGKPAPVADGQLLLAEVMPSRKAEAPVAPGDYRFGFRFDGGL